MSFMSLKNYFLRDWICGGGSRTAGEFDMKLFVTMVHGCEPLITIVVMNSILDVKAVALDPPLDGDTLYSPCKFYKFRFTFNK